MRLKLRISKHGHTWLWVYEDWDLPYRDRVLDYSSEEFATWPEAEAAGRAAYPDAPDVMILAVRGHGTEYPDSL